MAPADNPSVVILVVMDEPQGGSRDGGQVSAPVFREIAEQILPELKVVPDTNIRQETLTAEDIPTEIEANSDDKSAKTAKKEKSDKKTSDAEKPKDLKESKKENKPPDKKGTKQKTAALMIETPKNKFSGAREAEKT